MTQLEALLDARPGAPLKPSAAACASFSSSLAAAGAATGGVAPSTGPAAARDHRKTRRVVRRMLGARARWSGRCCCNAAGRAVVYGRFAKKRRNVVACLRVQARRCKPLLALGALHRLAHQVGDDGTLMLASKRDIEGLLDIVGKTEVDAWYVGPMALIAVVDIFNNIFVQARECVEQSRRAWAAASHALQPTRAFQRVCRGGNSRSYSFFTTA